MRNIIDSELKIIYIYRGIKFFTRQEALEFQKLDEEMKQNEEQEKEMLRAWKQQQNQKKLSLMKEALEKS
jgi:hypothetical protein